jgi:hypothetical protein
VFAAETADQIRPGKPASFHRRQDKLLNPAFQRTKRIAGDTVKKRAAGHKGGKVVTGYPQGGLGQIVGTKAEEPSVSGDFPGPQRGGGKLYHSADGLGHGACLLFGLKGSSSTSAMSAYSAPSIFSP